MNRIVINIIFLALIFPSQSNVGTNAAQFLGIGVGSRAMSMGGAFTSMVNDPSSLYWNPGAIPYIEGNKFQITNATWLVDTSWLYGSYIYNVNSRSSIAGNIFYLDYGDEEITTIYDQDGTGSYWTASDISMGLYYGVLLTNKFSFGGGAKYIRQSIYNESASTIAFDLGILYLNTNNNFRLGVNISNIGTEVNLEGNDLYLNCDIDTANSGNNPNIPCILETEKFPLPILYRIGISKDYYIGSDMVSTGSVDWVIPNDDVEHFNLGLEISYKKRLFVRAGYRHIGKEDTEEGLTLGLGANLYLFGMDFDLNYTYHDFGIFGHLPYFEFIFNF